MCCSPNNASAETLLSRIIISLGYRSIVISLSLCARADAPLQIAGHARSELAHAGTRVRSCQPRLRPPLASACSSSVFSYLRLAQ